MSYEQLSLFTDEELGITPNIIGLTGYAQSGKDTLAKILVDNYGYRRVAFADKIREFLYEVNPMVGCSPTGYLRDLVNLVGWDNAKQEPQVRRLLQDLGVGARKVFGDDFWVTQAFVGISPPEKIVITDVRFTNEAETIKQHSGAQVWRVKRSGVSAVNTHVSETEMDGHPVDQIFVNNGSIEDLENLVNSRMKHAFAE
jgi:hypothetical protein